MWRLVQSLSSSVVTAGAANLREVRNAQEAHAMVSDPASQRLERGHGLRRDEQRSEELEAGWPDGEVGARPVENANEGDGRHHAKNLHGRVGAWMSAAVMCTALKAAAVMAATLSLVVRSVFHVHAVCQAAHYHPRSAAHVNVLAGPRMANGRRLRDDDELPLLPVTCSVQSALHVAWLLLRRLLLVRCLHLRRRLLMGIGDVLPVHHRLVATCLLKDSRRDVQQRLASMRRLDTRKERMHLPWLP